jgi:phospholipase/carboxylesterase
MCLEAPVKTKCISSVFEAAKVPSGFLMVVLHGRGDSAKGFEWLPEQLALSQLNYLFLNAPEKYYDGFSWYDFPPNQLNGVLSSRKLLDDTLQEIVEAGYLPENIFFLGFSQGCLMSLEWGLRQQRAFRGIIGISGYILDEKLLLADCAKEKMTKRIVVTHGSHDEVLPLARTSEQIEFLQKAGLEIDFRIYPKGHTILPQPELAEIKNFIESSF